MERPDPRRWLALALLCAAQFIVILDTSIIGVALPAIQVDLGFTPGGLSWIFNAYVIAFGGLLLLGGKLGDVFGARRMFMLGFAILTGASLLAGLATSQEVLLTGRALQGVGGALIAPTALAIIMRLFGGNGAELGKAFGFWGAAAAAGGTAGVFLGGVITEPRRRKRPRQRQRMQRGTRLTEPRQTLQPQQRQRAPPLPRDQRPSRPDTSY